MGVKLPPALKPVVDIVNKVVEFLKMVWDKVDKTLFSSEDPGVAAKQKSDAQVASHEFTMQFSFVT